MNIMYVFACPPSSSSIYHLAARQQHKMTLGIRQVQYWGACPPSSSSGTAAAQDMTEGGCNTGIVADAARYFSSSFLKYIYTQQELQL